MSGGFWLHVFVCLCVCVCVCVWFAAFSGMDGPKQPHSRCLRFLHLDHMRVLPRRKSVYDKSAQRTFQIRPKIDSPLGAGAAEQSPEVRPLHGWPPLRLVGPGPHGRHREPLRRHRRQRHLPRPDLPTVGGKPTGVKTRV